MEETSKIPSISNKIQSEMTCSPETSMALQNMGQTPIQQEQTISEENEAAPDNHDEENGEENLNRLLLVQNMAPAHMVNNQTKINRQMIYLNSKRLDWIHFIQECTGNLSQVTELAKDMELSYGSLSDHKKQQYSIFEADPAAYTWEGGFIQAEPSDQSKGKFSPILQQQQKTKKLHLFVLLGVFLIVKSGVFITQCLKSVRSYDKTQLFTLISIIEAFIYTSMLEWCDGRYRKVTGALQRDILEFSAELAVAVPRSLVSECGHAKFLKRQIAPQRWLRGLGVALFAAALFFASVPLSIANSQAFPVHNLVSYMSRRAASVTFLGITSIVPVASFVLLYFYTDNIHYSLSMMQKSMIMNLRGFLLKSNYALDYSGVHYIDEGLCYMFNQSPTVYFPYISVQDIVLHFEPYRVKLQYTFSNQELIQLDAKNNERAREILKRGYDQLVYDDILVWVVLSLQNQVKVWLPLSPTQLQYDKFAKTAMFGFTGCEISTLIQMIISQQQNDEGDEQQSAQLSRFQQIADFCYKYQQMRVEQVAEEQMHIRQLDRIFIPLVDE